jgi:hypothetical protein
MTKHDKALEALRRCEEQFDHYEKLHLEKSPPDTVKAATNKAMADVCRDAIASLSSARGKEERFDPLRLREWNHYGNLLSIRFTRSIAKTDDESLQRAVSAFVHSLSGSPAPSEHAELLCYECGSTDVIGPICAECNPELAVLVSNPPTPAEGFDDWYAKHIAITFGLAPRKEAARMAFEAGIRSASTR